MLQIVKRIIETGLKIRGLKLVPANKDEPFSPDMEDDFKKIYTLTKPFTMTSIERMYALYKSTQHIVRAKIPGDIVECGVWKGGSAMVSALTLLQLGITDRDIYLYDTYEGMSEPTEKDVHFTGTSAKSKWWKSKKQAHNEWCYASIEEVKENLAATGYPQKRIHFIKGPVESTIPATVPEKISILRLDTDWYDSTYHELIHLYPLISDNGFLIIDDYGCWQGARDAVNTYFEKDAEPVYLSRIDYTGRLAIKKS
ncbi:MAG: O-methyltransferase [Patescibacteria group bacterium]|nr:O-methyltransferase [Patescibacteria group bacterium]